MNKILIIFLIIFGIILSGCNQIDLGKVNLQNLSKEDINKVIVCDKPYIRYEAGCCLDKNSNKICDFDENSNLNNIQKNNFTIFSEKDKKLIKISLKNNTNRTGSENSIIDLKPHSISEKKNKDNFPKKIMEYKLISEKYFNNSKTPHNFKNLVLIYNSTIKNDTIQILFQKSDDFLLNKIMNSEIRAREYYFNSDLNLSNYENLLIIKDNLNEIYRVSWFSSSNEFNYITLNGKGNIKKEIIDWFLEKYPINKTYFDKINFYKKIQNKTESIQPQVQQKLATGFFVFEVTSNNTNDSFINKNIDTISASFQLSPGSDPIKLSDITLTLVSSEGAYSYKYNVRDSAGTTSTFGITAIRGTSSDGYMKSQDVFKLNIISAAANIGENTGFTLRFFPGTGNPLPVKIVTPPSMTKRFTVLK